MIFWHACMDVSVCGHDRHHRGILGSVLLPLITGGPAKSRKLPVDILLALSLSPSFSGVGHTGGVARSQAVASSGGSITTARR